jgi:hypothetical protein
MIIAIATNTNTYAYVKVGTRGLRGYVNRIRSWEDHDISVAKGWQIFAFLIYFGLVKVDSDWRSIETKLFTMVLSYNLPCYCLRQVLDQALPRDNELFDVFTIM